jgi:MFS family permease
LGLIEGIAESVTSFAQLFSGYLADRIERRKPVVVAGYFIANAVKPLLALVTAWPQILLIRFSDRLSKGFRAAPRDVMVAESVPGNRLGSAYGLIQAWILLEGLLWSPPQLWSIHRFESRVEVSLNPVSIAQDHTGIRSVLSIRGDSLLSIPRDSR